jgi:hypothetical protein
MRADSEPPQAGALVSAAHARRHPITLRIRARQLRDSGWAPSEVHRHLLAEGHEVSLDTVHRWTDEAYAGRHAQRDLARKRARPASGKFTPPNPPTPATKVARVRALVDLGISPELVAKVIEYDLGERVSGRQLRRTLMTGKWPGRERVVA